MMHDTRNPTSSTLSNTFKKKSVHFVSKMFYVNNKVLPKLTESRDGMYHNNNSNHNPTNLRNDDNDDNKRFQKYHLRKLKQQFRGLSFERDAYRVVKKQVLFQLDLYENPFNIKSEQQHNNSNKIYKAVRLELEKPIKRVKMQVINGMGTSRLQEQGNSSNNNRMQKQFDQNMNRQYGISVRKQQTAITNYRDGTKGRIMNNYFSNTAVTPINPLQSEPDNYEELLISQNSQMQLKEDILQNQECRIISLSPQRKRLNLEFDNHDPSLKFYVGPGNNANLIRRIMKKRIGWTQTSQSNSMFNFRWVQNSQNHKYEGTLSQNGYKQMLNHFSFHEEITTKSGLIRNLKILSQKEQKFNLFDVTPITFEVDFKLEEFCEPELKSFLHFFLENAPLDINEGKLNKRKEEQRRLYFDFVKKIKKIHNLQNHTYDKKQHPNSKPILKDVYKDRDNYLWLLKPADLNRGRGIYLFRTLNELSEILVDYYDRNQNLLKRTSYKPRQVSLVKEKTRESTIQKESDLQTTGINFAYPIKSQSFVIQKYIERPMLLSGRKYDIRVWVLLNHELQLYFFKEGYIRTSCQEFKLEKKDLFVHLTNNAVQKNSSNYGSFQAGNQLSFDALEKYFQEAQKETKIITPPTPKKTEEQQEEEDDDDGIMNLQQQEQSLQIPADTPPEKISFRTHIIPEMKRIIVLAFQSIKKKINTNTEKHCFEIYGFDFMIDEVYKPWLIEINTNPCIEESSPLLEKLLPRMLDDAFTLSLDLIFKNNNSPLLPKKQPIIQRYSVQKYQDTQNMWESISTFKTLDKKRSTKIRDRKQLVEETDK